METTINEITINDKPLVEKKKRGRKPTITIPHDEYIKGYCKKYYSENKDKNMVTCECGSKITRYAIEKHKLTKLHNNIMEMVKLKNN